MIVTNQLQTRRFCGKPKRKRIGKWVLDGRLERENERKISGVVLSLSLTHMGLYFIPISQNNIPVDVLLLLLLLPWMERRLDVEFAVVLIKTISLVVLH
jgi:hypothetical protein